MQTDKVRGLLEEYLTLWRDVRRLRTMKVGTNARQMQAVLDQIQRRTPTIEVIIEALDPALLDQILPVTQVGAYEKAVDAMNQALGILADRGTWDELVAPTAPSLVADRMHPQMWQAAATVWETGEYKTAVEQAARSLNAHIKSRVESHLNDRELVQQAFSPDLPKPGQKRLHFDGDRNDKNWQSRQQGLHLLAQGAFAGIRNIAAHTDDEWSEQVALEHLAVLSVVARWSDETEVVAADE